MLYLSLFYELAKAVALVFLPQLGEISIQSPAWYYAVPLLILPAIIILLMILDGKNRNLSILIPIIKLLSVISGCAYLFTTLIRTKIKLLMGDTDCLITVSFLMFFLLIDAIMGVMFFFARKVEKETNLTEEK